MKKAIVNIKGMHCRSCEILIEDELLKIPGVDRVNVSHKKGCAEIYYNNGLDEKKVEHVITESGYSTGKDEKPFFSKNKNDYIDIITAVLILIFLYILADNAGLFNLINLTSSNYASIPVVFLIGITAGLSTCMALVGGLVLGASAKFAERHPKATSTEKFKPHLFFNLGRIASYTFFGAIIGWVGSFFQISTLLLGILTVVVGLVMLLLGAQLIDISPKLRSFSFTLPKGVSRLFGLKEQNEKEYSHNNSMILGGLTFFLPCGFTQAMQLYAISTGDPVKGAMTMGIFALGTAPGLLGIGGLTSVVKGEFAKSFFRFAGIVVIALAFFNISNGYNLTGFNLVVPFSANADSSVPSDPNVILENGLQVVKMTQNSSGYIPNTFTIKKDIPVKWVINSEDVNTCASTIVSAGLGVKRGLSLGDNIIEFTPKEAGQIKFSCIMGMYNGVFNVVDSLVDNDSTVSNIQNASPASNQGASCGTGGGGCGCGGSAAQQNLNNSASVTPVPPANEGDIQVIKTIYTQDNDIQPNKFTVKSGKPVRMEIDVKDDGIGCMGSITIPGLTQKTEIFTKDKPIVFNFTPSKPGNYSITCGMGMPRGVIIAN